MASATNTKAGRDLGMLGGGRRLPINYDGMKVVAFQPSSPPSESVKMC